MEKDELLMCLINDLNERIAIETRGLQSQIALWQVQPIASGLLTTEGQLAGIRERQGMVRGLRIARQILSDHYALETAGLEFPA